MQAPFSGDRHYQKADAKTVIYGESIPFTAILLTDDQAAATRTTSCATSARC